MVSMKKTENKKTKVKGNKKPFFTISKKILALSLLPMIIVCALVATVGAKALETGIEKQIEQSLQIVGVSVDETYTNLYEGDYTRDKGGKVRKGGTSISGETQLIDGLQEKTGFQVSFLYGNMRLITTLTKPEGGRINGTALEDDVYAQIQTGEALFLTDCNISEVDYYVYYQPLINSDGSVIGAIEVATPMQNVKDTISMQVRDIILIAVACVLVAATLVSVLSPSMKKTKHFLGRIVNGELDAEPDEKQCRKKDELGDVYRISVKLQKTLRSIVTEIKDSADDLTASSNKLIKMAQDTQESVNDVYHAVGEISDGARNQANETTDANENVVRIGEQIEYISEEVKSLTDYAGRMAEAEKASEEIMKELNGSNESTKESVLRVAEQITDMNGAIQNITKAVSMIQDIADETDLLSLNASIEAARAGEAGRGFAVVAEQISKLADQSKRSATEIQQIIQNIMESSGRMVEIMGEVEANMNHQQSKLEETGVKTAAVADGVENSLQHIDGIREKMDVLGQSGSAIRDVVEGLSAISEQNAASADSTMQAAHGMSDTMTELMNSSENLLALADKLEKVLDVFKV